jgi:hypothetical protein
MIYGHCEVTGSPVTSHFNFLYGFLDEANHDAVIVIKFKTLFVYVDNIDTVITAGGLLILKVAYPSRAVISLMNKVVLLLTG